MAKLTKKKVIATLKVGKGLWMKDLSELDLSGNEFPMAELSMSNLGRANLSNAKLMGVHFIKARLREANLSSTDLSLGILTQADLVAADLRGACFYKANIRDANLAYAILQGADLSEADLTGANIYNIAYTGWEIKNIKCEYVYYSREWWKTGELEKTRRNFAPGEFEMLYGSKKFDVTISFAGPEREWAEKLATRIKEAGFYVFYDDFYPEMTWGKDLTVLLDTIYRKNSRFCVIFCSAEYLDRMWPTHERKCALARQLQEKDNEYVLPIKVDNTELPGMPPTIGYLPLGEYGIDEIAEILIKKLRTPTKQPGM